MKKPSLATVHQDLRADRLGEAERGCADYLRQRPDDVNGLLAMAAIRHRLGDASHAAHSLEAAAKASLDSAENLARVIHAMHRIGRAELAGQYIATLLEQYPGALGLAAQNSWQRGRYALALDQFRRWAAARPDNPEATARLARALLRTGRFDEAESVVTQGLARFPEFADLIRLRVTQLLDEGGPPVASEQAALLPAESDENRLLLDALSTLNSAAAFDPYPSSSARVQALADGHRWLLEQPGTPRWFGSGTALLKWAARTAPEGGITVECGVYHGLSASLLAGWSDGEIHGFDSFEGLPEDWKPGEPAGSYSTGGRRPELADRVSLHAGWFDETLPNFAAVLNEPIRLLHVDCDIYSSTVTVLNYLGPHLVPGSLLVFDDFLGYPGYAEHEFRAAQKYFSSGAMAVRLVAAVLLGRSVAFRVEGTS